MNLTELKQAVDRAMEQAQRMRRNPDGITVGVVLNTPGIVGTALAGVESVHVGIDWDGNRCLIWPETKLVADKCQ